MVGSCVRSSILHGSENWPVRKENEVGPQSAEMRMVRRMCGIKRERERLGIDDMTVVTAKQAAMVWACVSKRR